MLSNSLMQIDVMEIAGLKAKLNVMTDNKRMITIPYPRENKSILNKRPSPLLLRAQGYFTRSRMKMRSS